MDIKRVAFETKSLNSGQQSEGSKQLAVSSKQTVKREDIAAIVDKFLSQKLSELPNTEVQSPNTEVKTIIHEVKTPEIVENKPTAVDFVSEDDVKSAIAKGEKIWINEKTIITPSARDIGEAQEIFAKV
jgi:hypothetical protein